MRTALLPAIALSAFFAVHAFAFNPDELNRITFENATGTVIETIFLSPADSTSWGADLIGADHVLGDGTSVAYYLHYPGASFTFDLLATDDKGNWYEIRGVQAADDKEGRTALTSASRSRTTGGLAPVTVRILNKTGREIRYLFVSQSDSRAWGADLLDQETTLADGGSHTILLLAGRDKKKYSLLAVDAGNEEYRFNVMVDPATARELTWVVEPTDLRKAK